MHQKYQALYALTWHYILVKPSPRLLKYQALNPHGHAATVEDQLSGLARFPVARRPSKTGCGRHAWPHLNVRRGKARFPSGRQTHPATFAPAGSNRSSRGGDEAAEAFGAEGPGDWTTYP